MFEADIGEVTAAPRVIASATGVARNAEPEGPYVDPAAIDRLGRFGPVPDRWYKTPEYARRVRARLAALEAEVKDAEKRAASARSAFDDAMVATGLRGFAWMKTTYRPTRGSYLKTLDRLGKRENDLRAVDAQVAQEAESARTSLVAALEKLGDLRADLVAARAQGNAAKVAELERALAEAGKERDAVERMIRVPAKSLDAKVEKARADFRAACSDFARFILDDPENFGEEFAEPRVRVEQLRASADAAEVGLLTHRAATTAFDQDAVNMGKGVMIAAIALGVIAVIGGIIALV
jgi:hypothetical protein